MSVLVPIPDWLPEDAGDNWWPAGGDEYKSY